MFDLDVTQVESELHRAAAKGWTKHRSGALAGWVLTPAGLVATGEKLAEELDRYGLRVAVEHQYQRFVALNPRALDICSRWQVLPDGQLNAHDDFGYDQMVVGQLVNLNQQAQPLCRQLGRVLHRFGRYGPGLGQAVAHVKSGAQGWFVGATIESFHTLWFELHTDLLVTLGRNRAMESPGLV